MQLAEYKDQLEALGIKLVGVALDDRKGLAATEKEAGLPTFSVSENVLDALGLKHVNGHPIDKKNIARPALVLLDRRGRVLWMEAVSNYRVRPEPEAVMEKVKSILNGEK